MIAQNESATAPHGKPEVLVLVGPTAVGKTNLSLEIAERYGCEIISGDSMQVYRRMDIGTAKASSEERSRIPHHMIDIHEPHEPFTVAEFQERARELIADIHSRGKLPFIVGGTGLYIESLIYGFQFSEAGSDEAFRERMSLYADEHGDLALHDKLKRQDPLSAERIHPNDRRRTIRALEVLHLTGTRLSEQLASQKKRSPYESCIIGLTMDRTLLYNRIERRIDQMMEEGLVQEVRRLLHEGVERTAVAMQGLGYKEMAGCLAGEMTLEEAVNYLKRNTRRYAKRQLSWFRHMQEIHWVELEEGSNISEHLKIINDIITGKFPFRREYNAKRRNDAAANPTQTI
ncbi:tRNA (adenosine(37)-N6)-dimethylallyltransferase MiaA [Paenibacillus koleovorans]|uniref:tRNA (adenosine(37)-N6)-dimethylallyltransferase MiaA n=1 Tax=Paenibacillus koleovorans TaxID=121608 RepID=UPI0024832527|nr:tRNA (adenosine(37)-N6)-dimethylallyltransferase MiaA [Paenibacillus koleovorans]